VNGYLDRGYRILGASFYRQPTGIVAKGLLGKYLVRSLDGVALIGRIVETEAYYYRDDPACHAYKGKTKRNEVMFGSCGRAYVYFTYGNHYLLNVVTNKVGHGEAALIRALEPVEGLDVMRRNRGCDNEIGLTNGPGKLAQALAIDLKFNGCDLRASDLIIARRELLQNFRIGRSRRIGISDGKELLERYYIAGNRFVSVHPKD
jgi:DNA-3-methyladenine glycosylase